MSTTLPDLRKAFENPLAELSTASTEQAKENAAMSELPRKIEGAKIDGVTPLSNLP